jgi:6-pyruvoyl-tetrahydropterin synthase
MSIFFIYLCAILPLLMVYSSQDGGTFSLGVRDSIMIAHSFHSDKFGPATQMHGATYTVDVDFVSESLEEDVNWVIDIGIASDLLSRVLQRYNFQNLNEVFPGENTTTEFMCRVIHKDLQSLLNDQKCFTGKMSVKLHESHKAWASFTADV